ncbi:MAG TPA: orotate phosphoribosyltransferase [Alphaproteobacteria bacterium]|nr:orotate phosphoribosyltransferase [Alphaproteobacteria bacterium]
MTRETSPTGRTVARILLEIEAVHFRPREPFKLTSGRLSPVYIDCRKIIGFPRARAKVIDLAVAHIEEAIGFERIDVVAGGETAGIPFAAWIAERLALPMVYVRKTPKGFGRGAQLEGNWKDGDRMLLVEDLATDGGSKLGFIEAIRKAGADVANALVIFHYGIFPASTERLAELGVRLHGLATWWDVLAEAEASGALSGSDLAAVRRFLEAPEGWTGA